MIMIMSVINTHLILYISKPSRSNFMSQTPMCIYRQIIPDDDPKISFGFILDDSFFLLFCQRVYSKIKEGKLPSQVASILHQNKLN